MAKFRFPLLFLLVFVLGGSLQADDVYSFGRWKITYTEGEGSFKINYQREDGTYRPVFVRSVPEAHYDKKDGTSRAVKVTDFSQHTFSTSSVTDDFGTGTRYDFVFSTPANGDDVQLAEHIWTYDGLDFILMSLELIGSEEIRSNYLSPVNCATTYILFSSNNNNRMLKVPFDNDGFLRYYRYPMRTSMTSYEAAAFYEGESRQGLVVGSVDHDHWKSAVRADTESNGKIKALSLYSGAAGSETRDVLPHGKLVGKNISSARFFVGVFDDWRDGMETFAEACNVVHPKRNNWTAGRPVGWQTWGVMEAHNNYTDDKEVFQYFHETLQPAGFTNGKGKQIMSIDAWSGLSSNDEKYLIAQADTSELMVGCYGNPFCLWWDTKDTTCLNQTYYSSSLSSYKAKEVVLRANGKPIVYDGAYCLDPTHPAVKAQSASWIRSQINKGYRYFKLDFVTNGIMEADRYYNPEVHTGVEAYNEGFAYFVKQVDKFDVPVFIDLSIAPLFPYHYANGRRQACDTWGTIGWTEYSMNAITAGWWTNGLYQYNDPDGLPMVGHGDQGSTTLAENRSRLTNGIVSGHVLLADNFSVTNSSGRGNPELSRTRAKSLFTNADINAMLALDPNFRPVYGYNEYNGSSSGAEATVIMTTDEYFYVVVFNYNSSVNAANITGTIPLDILGFTKEDFSSVKELWFGTTEEIKDGLSYNIPSRDCRVYRFTRTKPDAIGQVEKVDSEQITIESQGNQFIVHSQLPIRRVSCYDLAGRRLSLKNEDSYQTTLPIPTKKGVVIVSVTLANGKTYNKKLKL